MSSSTGLLEGIWIKRARRGPMDPAETGELVEGTGLVGNADQGGRRQVTVIAAEAWADAEDELGASVDPSARRANLLVRGLDLRESRGRILAIGETKIHLLGETRPCPRMDEAHSGLMSALGRDWRGGAFGQVVEGGAIQLGDAVSWDGELALPERRRSS